MGASNTEGSKTSYFKLKAKTSDTDPTAFFGRNAKVGSEWQITEKFNQFSGHLASIEHSTYEYQGETKHKLQMKLKDVDGSMSIIEAGFNSLVYSLLNCLANCEPSHIEMSLSLGKAKIINGKEGKRYPNIWVKNNGEEVKWKYAIADIPRPAEVKVGGKTVKDDTKVVEFWLSVLNNEIKPKLKTEIEKAPQTESHVPDPEGDGLPF